MPTRVYATFGVYGRPSEDEQQVLELADEFRLALANLLHRRHRAVTDYRDEHFPELWAAMTEFERWRARIYEIEKAIKAYHSEVRDRNAVTEAQSAELIAARDQRSRWLEAIRAHREDWYTHLRAFSTWWGAAADWKNVKSLARRREAYASLRPPPQFASYCAIHQQLDLEERELSRAYQDRGLHSAIRAEIVEATQQKFGETGPGMRYWYGERPTPKPWRKLTLQFSGGVRWRDVLDNNVIGLTATPIYTNHPAGGAETVYEITQQIGTRELPHTVSYSVKLDKPIPDESVIQRWSLVNDKGRRSIMPIIKDIPPKRQGDGTFEYTLSWSQRPNGVEIAQFVGEHVQESLVLPTWLVAKRMSYAAAQQACDNRANDFLETRGISRSKRPGSRHGVIALGDYFSEHPTDLTAGNLLDTLQGELRRTSKAAASALRCIEDIYRSTAAKVCRLHAAVFHPAVPLQRAKRYAKRDLLKRDPMTKEERELLHAMAPGKLRAAVAAYGLASGTVRPERPYRPDTDLFTTYVNTLGRTTGTKTRQPCRRSQHRP